MHITTPKFFEMKFLESIILLLLITTVQAKETIIRGIVTERQDQTPLEDATIKVIGQNNMTLTDSKGSFEIPVKNESGQLKIDMLGYKTAVVEYHSDQPTMHIQMESDIKNLNEVIVSAYGNNRKSKETAGAIAFLSSEDIKQGSGVSMQAALNSVPGVRMDQSTLSEARISIRGNGVRAPYGIRNIKIYINDIPFTEADGTTRIEGIDINDLGSAEILKGPASSIYGGGTGGVINFKLARAPYQERSLSLHTLAGSDGLIRVGTNYQYGGDKMNAYLSYGWQRYQGYRQHSKDKRNFLTANFLFYPSSKQTFTVLVNRTSQNTQIPGALTLEQFNDDPRQAAQTNLDKDAGRKQNWTRVGIGQSYHFNDRISNSTTIFTYFYDLNHPLPYAYIRNTYQSFGGRTRFNFKPNFRLLETEFILGTEFNQGYLKGSQYVNNGGQEGAIKSNTDYRNTFFSVFYQSTTHLFKKAFLTLGVSYNGLNYQVKDYLNPISSGDKKFKPKASPRVALSYNFGDYLSLHVGVSTGFSPPTGSEIKNQDGTINQNIQAEEAINYEINAKGNLFKTRLAYELSLYKMNMKGELIAQTVEQGITIYNNSGKTSHEGVELALSYQIFNENDHKSITALRPYLAVTYSHFRFKDYQIKDKNDQVISNFDGNKLTGISPWDVDAGINLETKWGIYTNLSYYFSDKLPLNDANTAFNSAYSTLNLKLGYQKQFGKHFNLEVYAGADNLTNTRYSSYNALNAKGFNASQPAYFNPSPRITGYGGLHFKYIF